MSIGTVFVLSLWTLGSSFTPQAGTRGQEPMNNASVISMAKAGLGAEVVIGAIRAAPSSKFDLSVEALITLKKSGVPDLVIRAMQSSGVHPASGNVTSPARPAARDQDGLSRSSAAISTNAPLPRHDPGIYVDLGQGPRKLEPLEPTGFTQGKTGGLLGSIMTRGIKKMNWKAVIRGSAAQLRIGNGLPVFYFYFEAKNSGFGNPGGFGGWMAAATSPNEFVLVRLRAAKSERTLIVGESGALGASTGTRSQDTIDVSVERLAVGVYKVSPKESMTVGEYCFFYAAGVQTFGMGTAGKLFDFGIDPLPRKR